MNDTYIAWAVIFVVGIAAGWFTMAFINRGR
jgi:hypothetical protein